MLQSLINVDDEALDRIQRVLRLHVAASHSLDAATRRRLARALKRSGSRSASISVAPAPPSSPQQQAKRTTTASLDPSGGATSAAAERPSISSPKGQEGEGEGESGKRKIGASRLFSAVAFLGIAPKDIQFAHNDEPPPEQLDDATAYGSRYLALDSIDKGIFVHVISRAIKRLNMAQPVAWCIEAAEKIFDHIDFDSVGCVSWADFTSFLIEQAQLLTREKTTAESFDRYLNTPSGLPPSLPVNAIRGVIRVNGTPTSFSSSASASSSSHQGTLLLFLSKSIGYLVDADTMDLQHAITYIHPPVAAVYTPAINRSNIGLPNCNPCLITSSTDLLMHVFDMGAKARVMFQLFETRTLRCPVSVMVMQVNSPCVYVGDRAGKLWVLEIPSLVDQTRGSNCNPQPSSTRLIHSSRALMATLYGSNRGEGEDEEGNGEDDEDVYLEDPNALLDDEIANFNSNRTTAAEKSAHAAHLARRRNLEHQELQQAKRHLIVPSGVGGSQYVFFDACVLHAKVHAKHITSIIPLRDGTHHVLTGSFDGYVKTIDIQTGNIVKSFHAHSGGVSHMVYSEKQGFLITQGYLQSTCIWVGTQGTHSFKLFDGNNPHLSEVVGLEVVDSLQQIITADVSGLVKVWDITKNACVSNFFAKPELAGITRKMTDKSVSPLQSMVYVHTRQRFVTVGFRACTCAQFVRGESLLVAHHDPIRAMSLCSVPMATITTTTTMPASPVLSAKQKKNKKNEEEEEEGSDEKLVTFDAPRTQTKPAATTRRELLHGLSQHSVLNCCVTATATEYKVWSLEAGGLISAANVLSTSRSLDLHGEITTCCVDGSSGARVYLGTACGFVFEYRLISGQPLKTFQIVDPNKAGSSGARGGGETKAVKRAPTGPSPVPPGTATASSSSSAAAAAAAAAPSPEDVAVASLFYFDADHSVCAITVSAVAYIFSDIGTTRTPQRVVDTRQFLVEQRMCAAERQLRQQQQMSQRHRMSTVVNQSVLGRGRQQRSDSNATASTTFFTTSMLPPDSSSVNRMASSETNDFSNIKAAILPNSAEREFLGRQSEVLKSAGANTTTDLLGGTSFVAAGSSPSGSPVSGTPQQNLRSQRHKRTHSQESTTTSIQGANATSTTGGLHATSSTNNELRQSDPVAALVKQQQRTANASLVHLASNVFGRNFNRLSFSAAAIAMRLAALRSKVRKNIMDNTDTVTAVAHSQHLKFYALGTVSGAVRVVDTGSNTGSPLYQMQLPSEIACILFLSMYPCLITADANGGITFFATRKKVTSAADPSLSRRRSMANLGPGGGGGGTTFAPGHGRRVSVSSVSSSYQQQPTSQSINREERSLFCIEHGVSPTCLAFDPVYGCVIVGDIRGRLACYRIVSGLVHHGFAPYTSAVDAKVQARIKKNMRQNGRRTSQPQQQPSSSSSSDDDDDDPLLHRFSSHADMVAFTSCDQAEEQSLASSFRLQRARNIFQECLDAHYEEEKGTEEKRRADRKAAIRDAKRKKRSASVFAVAMMKKYGDNSAALLDDDDDDEDDRDHNKQQQGKNDNHEHDNQHDDCPDDHHDHHHQHRSLHQHVSNSSAAAIHDIPVAMRLELTEDDLDGVPWTSLEGTFSFAAAVSAVHVMSSNGFIVASDLNGQVVVLDAMARSTVAHLNAGTQFAPVPLCLRGVPQFYPQQQQQQQTVSGGDGGQEKPEVMLLGRIAKQRQQARAAAAFGKKASLLVNDEENDGETGTSGGSGGVISEEEIQKKRSRDANALHAHMIDRYCRDRLPFIVSEVREERAEEEREQQERQRELDEEIAFRQQQQQYNTSKRRTSVGELAHEATSPFSPAAAGKSDGDDDEDDPLLRPIKLEGELDITYNSILSVAPPSMAAAAAQQVQQRSAVSLSGTGTFVGTQKQTEQQEKDAESLKRPKPSFLLEEGTEEGVVEKDNPSPSSPFARKQHARTTSVEFVIAAEEEEEPPVLKHQSTLAPSAEAAKRRSQNRPPQQSETDSAAAIGVGMSSPGGVFGKTAKVLSQFEPVSSFAAFTVSSMSATFGVAPPPSDRSRWKVPLPKDSIDPQVAGEAAFFSKQQQQQQQQQQQYLRPHPPPSYTATAARPATAHVPRNLCSYLWKELNLTAGQPKPKKGRKKKVGGGGGGAGSGSGSDADDNAAGDNNNNSSGNDDFNNSSFSSGNSAGSSNDHESNFHGPTPQEFFQDLMKQKQKDARKKRRQQKHLRIIDGRMYQHHRPATATATAITPSSAQSTSALLDQPHQQHKQKALPRGMLQTFPSREHRHQTRVVERDMCPINGMPSYGFVLPQDVKEQVELLVRRKELGFDV